jgi:hypothetical protein
MNIGELYQWFWFHTEFWLTPTNRRPYTFIMRDWIYTHANIAAAMMLAWFAGMIVLSVWHGTLATVLSILSGLITAHLVWGSAWIEGQQEVPEYLG